MFSVAIAVVTAVVILAVGACIWKLPDPHHQQIAYLWVLLDFDHSVGTPLPLTKMNPTETKQQGSIHTRNT